MPMRYIGRKPVLMQNFKSSTATVIELRFFMKKKKMKKMKNLCKSYSPVFHTSCDIFIFFACSYFFTCSPP